MLPTSPYASADLPGLPAPCVVAERICEEVLVRQPGRTGDHHWIKVAKTNLGTQQARAALARSVGIDPELVVCAGNRDRIGRCVQWFSIAKVDVDHPGPLRRAGAHGKMQVLELTESHKPVTPALVERLRWQVRLRGGARAEGYRLARAIMDRLRQTGCPNFFDPGRFGEGGALVGLGRQLVAGRRLQRGVTAGTDPGRCQRALQEWVFNTYVQARLGAGTLATCLPGEVLRSSSGQVEVVADPTLAQKQIDSWGAVALGPIFGAGMAASALAASAFEGQVLEHSGLTLQALDRLSGERRPIRVQPTRTGLDPHRDDLTITCDLPTDTYISVLLDEFLRSQQETTTPAEEA